MPPVVRFAPSPTGFLHIGGARTALFNWLFARHHGGAFRLRIEDTDRLRSTKAAVDAIIDGLKWLGLDWDGDIIMQSERAARHAAVVGDMLAAGTAYRCYCSPEELAATRERQRAAGKPIRYEGVWRDRDANDAPAGVAPVIRIKAQQTGITVVRDAVQGEVRVANDQLDDMVLLRADGTPTYMLSVVVDDHDMGVTHIIRGDDHLTNTFRQLQIYRALGWEEPVFGHIPLIHGPDGAKLSKRHGALGIEAYRDMGYLPEALRNYLLRLGWAHGDDEIISSEDAIAWFDLDAVGRSPSRLDFAKLDNLNSQYLRNADDGRLVELILPMLSTEHNITDEMRRRLLMGMPGLKERAKKLTDLAESADFYVAMRPLALEPKAAATATPAARALMSSLAERLDALTPWEDAELQAAIREQAEKSGMKLGQVAQPLRAALTGSTISPGIFEIMHVLGKPETIGRIQDFVAGPVSA